MFTLDLSEYDAAETLASTARLHAFRRQIDAELLQHGQHFAELHPDPATIPGHVTIPGGELGRVWGGPGCPGVAEFAAAEFGAAIGRSAGSSARYLGQALALLHRFPRIWERVVSNQAEGWKACTIATACLALSEDAAAEVDRRVADIVDTVTPLRLSNIVKAAIWHADPEAARAAAEEKARECGVWTGRTDDYGTTTLFLRAPTGDVIRFRTTVQQIADALAALGDTDSVDQRRAKAVGIISDPALTEELLRVANHLTPAPSPEATAQPSSSKGEASGFTYPPSDPTAGGSDIGGRFDCGTFDSSAREPVGHRGWSGRHDDAVADPQRNALEDARSGECESNAQGAEHLGEQLSGHSAEEVAGQVSHRLADRLSDPPCDAADGAATGGAGAGSAGGALVSDCSSSGGGAGMDRAERRELAVKLAEIQRAAYSRGAASASVDGPGTAGGTSTTGGLGAAARAGAADVLVRRARRGRTVIYTHITDETLLAGGGVARVEGFGPVFAAKLEELLGHDQIVVQPVIDLRGKVSVDAYEVPRRIRERIKLTHPVEQFIFGTAETTNSTDLDHIRPYDFNATGPPRQTSTGNLSRR